MDENIRPRSLARASKDRLSRRESWGIALLLLMISGWAVWQMSQHNRFEIVPFQDVGHPTAYILDTQTGEVKRCQVCLNSRSSLTTTKAGQRTFSDGLTLGCSSQPTASGSLRSSP